MSCATCRDGQSGALRAACAHIVLHRRLQGANAALEHPATVPAATQQVLTDLCRATRDQKVNRLTHMPVSALLRAALPAAVAGDLDMPEWNGFEQPACDVRAFEDDESTGSSDAVAPPSPPATVDGAATWRVEPHVTVAKDGLPRVDAVPSTLQCLRSK